MIEITPTWMLHETAHALCNLAYGAVSITIQPSADGTTWQTIPEWPSAANVSSEAVFGGSIAGLLVPQHASEDDFAMNRLCPDDLRCHITEICLQVVKPQLLEITAATLADMCLEANTYGGIRVFRDPESVN